MVTHISLILYLEFQIVLSCLERAFALLEIVANISISLWKLRRRLSCYHTNHIVILHRWLPQLVRSCWEMLHLSHLGQGLTLIWWVPLSTHVHRGWHIWVRCNSVSFRRYSKALCFFYFTHSMFISKFYCIIFWYLKVYNPDSRDKSTTFL